MYSRKIGGKSQDEILEGDSSKGTSRIAGASELRLVTSVGDPEPSDSENADLETWVPHIYSSIGQGLANRTGWTTLVVCVGKTDESNMVQLHG